LGGCQILSKKLSENWGLYRGINWSSINGISAISICRFVKTKPIQVPQLRNGEQALQSPSSLGSCEWLLVFSVIVSSSQLSSEQQGTTEREKTYNDKMKQSVFMGANITNICGGYENVGDCATLSRQVLSKENLDLTYWFNITYLFFNKFAISKLKVFFDSLRIQNITALMNAAKKHQTEVRYCIKNKAVITHDKNINIPK